MHLSPLRKQFKRCCRGMVLGFILSLDFASAQTTRTWTGAVNNDWFNATNWSPNGVPAGNDIVNFASGTINFSAPVTIGGQFNWSGGVLSGQPLTIASNAVMNINCVSQLTLENALTNAGTVTLTNTGGLEVANGAGIYFAFIENLAGALFDLQSDEGMMNNASGPAYFHNAGTLRKSAQTGTSSILIPLFNSGSVTGLQGTLSFGGGGSLSGNFAASGGANITFSGGTFSNSVPVAISGPGAVQFTSGNLFLLADAIPNLALTGGTVNLGPAFQGGTITNLTITGSTLAGTNVVTGIFNLDNGNVAGGPLTIASNGVMNINATSQVMLEIPLTNFGTVAWTNTGIVDVAYGSGLYFGLIENLGLFDIQSDESLFNNVVGAAYFHNAGTLRKSSKTGSSNISIPLFNSGVVTALQGTLSFSGGGTLAGSFAAAAGANISFSGGTFSNSSPCPSAGRPRCNSPAARCCC